MKRENILLTDRTKLSYNGVRIYGKLLLENKYLIFESEQGQRLKIPIEVISGLRGGVEKITLSLVYLFGIIWLFLGVLKFLSPLEISFLASINDFLMADTVGMLFSIFLIVTGIPMIVIGMQGTSKRKTKIFNILSYVVGALWIFAGIIFLMFLMQDKALEGTMLLPIAGIMLASGMLSLFIGISMSQGELISKYLIVEILDSRTILSFLLKNPHHWIDFMKKLPVRTSLTYRKNREKEFEGRLNSFLSPPVYRDLDKKSKISHEDIFQVINCPFCGRSIPKDSVICSYCRKELHVPPRLKKLLQEKSKWEKKLKELKDNKDNYIKKGILTEEKYQEQYEEIMDKLVDIEDKVIQEKMKGGVKK